LIDSHVTLSYIHRELPIHAYFATARKKGRKYNNMIEHLSSSLTASIMTKAPGRKGQNMFQAIRGRVIS